MNFDELVQIVLKEVMSQIENKNIEYKSDKKAVVFFTGASKGLEESITEIRKLKNYGVNLKAVLSESALNIIDMNIINDIFNSENIYIDGKSKNNKAIYEEEFDLLIGANLSINSLSKASSGISDTLPTALISKCILNGTKIIISKDEVDLGNSYKNIPIAYTNMIKGHLDRLESYGIKMINSKEIFNYATREDIKDKDLVEINSKEKVLTKLNTQDNLVTEVKSIKTKETSLECKIDRKVISREDIASNSENIKIIVPSNSIITALAKDLADELGIEIIKR